MKTLRELSVETFYKMHHYSQLTIDLVQGTEDLFLQENTISDDFGAMKYNVDVLLEVIDETRTRDIEVLESLSFILTEKIKEFN